MSVCKIGALFITATLFSCSAVANELPDKETKFIEIVNNAISETSSAKNDMQRGGIKVRRDDAICKGLKKRTVSGWVGKVKTIDSNSDGKGIFEVEIAKDVALKTWNNAFSDVNYGTLIDPRSKLFGEASSLNVGDKVIFSGSFFRGDESCIKESSMSLSGGLKEPEFIFKFTDIKALN
ncbi:hypothetical protein [Lonsdalea britannica]|uniref:hypothetical protein n=1 Tax=Lonsdalea britannica TaxID=1082704 RepID=UPI0026EEE480|nr:hypothetical protein [Lonsdalea britannica]